MMEKTDVEAPPGGAATDKKTIARRGITGGWELVEVAADAMPAVAIDVTDDEYDPCVLGPAWENNRGRHMAYKWVHENPKWHGQQRLAGWEPVNPKHFSDPRYTVREIAGLGRCITFQDCVLFEMPRDLREKRVALLDERQKRQQLLRLYGLQENAQAAADEFPGLVKVAFDFDDKKGEIDPFGSRGGQIAAEARSLEAANAFMQRQAAEAERLRLR